MPPATEASHWPPLNGPFHMHIQLPRGFGFRYVQFEPDRYQDALKSDGCPCREIVFGGHLVQDLSTLLLGCLSQYHEASSLGVDVVFDARLRLYEEVKFTQGALRALNVDIADLEHFIQCLRCKSRTCGLVQVLIHHMFIRKVYQEYVDSVSCVLKRLGRPDLFLRIENNLLRTLSKNRQLVQPDSIWRHIIRLENEEMFAMTPP
ncbi:hypothetical protein BGX34_000813, partial [Mortierella sp. NVP85]